MADRPFYSDRHIIAPEADPLAQDPMPKPEPGIRAGTPTIQTRPLAPGRDWRSKSQKNFAPWRSKLFAAS